jgi:hypothetical protein
MDDLSHSSSSDYYSSESENEESFINRNRKVSFNQTSIQRNTVKIDKDKVMRKIVKSKTLIKK